MSFEFSFWTKGKSTKIYESIQIYTELEKTALVLVNIYFCLAPHERMIDKIFIVHTENLKLVLLIVSASYLPFNHLPLD